MAVAIMKKERIGLYAGSFDPVTNGHVDIARRAAGLFDHVVIAVARNPGKSPMFSVEERVVFLKDAFADCEGVSITSFSGLLVNLARDVGAKAIIKGLRAVSDFEFEFQMALMNRRLDPDIETVFLMTDAEKAFLSSSLVKEVALLGGDISGLVPEPVEQALRRKAGSAE